MAAGQARYVVHEPVGMGGMGTVYRAIDRLTGATVALKRVTAPVDALQFMSLTSGSDPYLALAREFQLLASLRHPHIISVLDYGFDDRRQPYYTMELLADARTLVEAGTTQPVAVRVRYILEMLQALAYLHRRGMVHRDLKPANVLIGADESVRVLDFGLALERTEWAAGGGMRGTLAYMAPEVLRGESPTLASDLYAVGVILYELLVGTHPYPTDDINQLVSNILASDPDLTPLRQVPTAQVQAAEAGAQQLLIMFGDLEMAVTFAEDEDNALMAVTRRLLAKDPDERYSDAETVIHDLCRALNQPVPEETAAIRESYLQAAAFVGRDAELATLRAALDEARAGEGSVWLIGGESGVGKSRLVEELRSSALLDGVLVLRGGAVAEAGGLPFHLWREPLRRFALEASLTDFEAGVLQALVPDISVLLGREVPPPPPLDGLVALQRLRSTIAQVFVEHSLPTLLVLEDLQWAQESLEALRVLASSAPYLPLLIVGTYRDDECAQLADDVPGAHLLRLERLDRAAIADLSAAMLGEAGRQPEVVDLLARETEGNVFFLVEVARALAEESGQLSAIGRSALPERVFAGGMQRLVTRRLARVPQEAVPFVKLAAVAGRMLDEAVLAAAGMPPRRWLVLLANAALMDVHDGRWRFAHDKLRESILAGLTADEVMALNAQVAQAIETVQAGSEAHAATLAYHWRHAGRPEREAGYALTAGKNAFHAANFRDALAYFERLRAIAADDALLTDAEYWLGETYDLLADYPRAEAFYTSSLARARARADQYQEANALAGLGTIRLHIGDAAVAAPHFDDALALYRAIGDAAGESSALRNLGICAVYLGAFERAIGLWQQSLAINRVTGDRRGEGGNISNIGAAYNYLGRNDLAVTYTEQALALRRELGDQQGEANDLGNLGNFYADMGQHERAIGQLTAAIAIRRRIGDRRGEANDANNLANIYRELGRFDDALPALEQTLALNREIGDRQGEGLTLTNLGLAYEALGQLDAAAGLLERALAIHRMLETARSECAVRGALGRLYCAAGRANEGVALLKQAIAMAETMSLSKSLITDRAALAVVLLEQGNAAAALDMVVLARTLDIGEINHQAALVHGLALLRLGDVEGGRAALGDALMWADKVLASAQGNYNARYARALALAAEALVAPGGQWNAARAAYRAAALACDAPGVLAEARRLLALLVPLDRAGALQAITRLLATG